MAQVIGSTAGTLPTTVAAWADLPEDEPGELVDGRIVEEEVPDNEHEEVVAWLLGVLRAWCVGRGGFVLGSGAKFQVAPARGRKPDVSVFLPGGRVPPRRGVNREPPDIAIEVVSGSPEDARRDRVVKLDEYARFGVRFYWIVDPAERVVEVYELGTDGRYDRAAGGAGGVLADLPGCAGLALDLDDLWRHVDRMGPPAAGG